VFPLHRGGRPWAGDALRANGDLSQRALRDDAPAIRPAARSHVDHVVGGGENVEVVVDDHDSGAVVEKAIEDGVRVRMSKGCSPVDGSSKM
jgi:hypothetical protein